MLAERKTSLVLFTFQRGFGWILSRSVFIQVYIAYRTTTSRGQLSYFAMVVILTAFIYYLLIDKGISPHNVESVGNKRI